MTTVSNNSLNFAHISSRLEACIATALAVGFIAWQIDLNSLQAVVLTGLVTALAAWHLLSAPHAVKPRLCFIAALLAFLLAFLSLSVGLPPALAAGLSFCISTVIVNFLALFMGEASVDLELLS